MTQPRLLGNRYEVGALIGYGGMAEVHRGKDLRLGRGVAIKILRSDLARDPTFQARFGREAQSAASLNHPSIVAVYDSGEDQSGDEPIPFIVMEYVEGHTLREVLNEHKRLAPANAAAIVADVCAALDYSHRNGIVHRDIKPGNVMITAAGAVKVMDFGIARALADNGATVTQTASVIGTAQYLSPEQARGETVDARSDVYSTGCLLYELVAGVPPFTGDSPVAVAYQHVRESAAPPSTVEAAIPRALDAVIMKALAKNPLNRYQTAAEMRADLQRMIAEQPVTAEAVMTEDERTQLIGPAEGEPGVPTGPAAGPGGPAGPPADLGYADGGAGRGRVIAWVGGVLALVAVLVIGGYFLLSGGGPPPAKTVAVPVVAGMDPGVAEQKLIDAKLKPVRSTATEPSMTIDAGKVSSTDPASGAVVNQGTSITYRLSSGPAKVQVPNLKGYPVQQAMDVLTGLNLVGTTQDVNQAAGAGTVIDQQPAALSEVDPQSPVTLSVSTGKIAIPDVTGRPYNDARTALNVGGFATVHSADGDPNTDPAKVGMVQSSDPSVGSVVDPSKTITLYLWVAAIPDVTGQTYFDAKNALAAVGMNSVQVTNGDPTLDLTKIGTVQKMDPPGGSVVDPTKTVTLTLYVAGPPVSPSATPSGSATPTGSGAPTSPAGGAVITVTPAARG
ncbi:MAG: Stk1 family PASTA domain-containing Ser/Thr kinase [Frankiaceae bacterium]|jgi:serine/threonine-protein kinase|nr:Stk1 family PASTA domain-containing Ser/Thr kinase [Frankiaceae bacterium]